MPIFTQVEIMFCFKHDDVTMMMIIRKISKNVSIVIILIINIIIMNMIITRNFYENFTGLSGDTLDKVATEGFRSMTAVGTMTMRKMTTMMMKMTMMMMMKNDDDDDDDDGDDEDELFLPSSRP